MPLRPTTATLALLPALLLLPSCAAPLAGYHAQQALFELDGANFERAHAEAKLALDRDPDSPALQRLHHQTRVLALLDRARELVFDDREVDALTVLAQVRVLDPENVIWARWLEKTRGQLGRKRVFEGEEALGRGELDQALALFREALELMPGHDAALRGYRDVGRIFSQRRETAEERYRLALEAQLAGDWRRVLHHARIAFAQDPSRLDAKRLVDAGERQYANSARLDALGHEEQRDFGAAARRYEEALRYGEKLKMDWAPRIRERLAMMRKEFEAEQLLSRFEIQLAAERFEDAERTLNEAQKMTQLQLGRLNAAKLALLVSRRQRRANEARLFEVDHRHEEAMAIYEDLIAQRGDDRLARRVERIQSLLATCKELLASARKAAAAGDRDAAIRDLKQILALHRRFQPAQDLLEKLTEATDSAGT